MMSSLRPASTRMTQPLSTINARMKDIAPNAVTEIIGEKVFFSYNVLTGNAFFTFQHRPYLFINGQPQSLVGNQLDSLDAPASDFLTTCFGEGLRDPVTNEDLGKVSTAGIELIIKAAFDKLYNTNYPSPPDAPVLSDQAILQSLSQYDLYGNGLNGYPLGKYYGGQGLTLPMPPDGYTDGGDGGTA